MNPERIKEILKEFSGKRILVVGDVMLDRYIKGRVERLNPEAPVPVLNAREQIDMTGGAGNVAKNVASLGAKATLLGVVGQDEAAQEIAAAAMSEGYEATLIADKSRPTTRKVRYVVGAQQLLRVDWEETPDVSAAIEQDILASFERVIDSSVDAIIVSDYAKGVVTSNVAERILGVAKEHDLPVAVDAKPSRIASFKGATFIAPNVKEAHEYVGLSHLVQGGKDIAQLAEQLLTTFATDVFMTLGAGGVYVCTHDGTRQHVPQDHTIAVADTSGAGDTAMAAMLLARLSGATPIEMAEIVNAAGAVVVSKVGAVGVTIADIQDMLLHRHEQSSPKQ